MISPTRTSVKIDYLRQNSYTNIKHWLSNPLNEYVGRKGRLFITLPNGEKEVFFYPASIWGNPFKVADSNIQDCLEKYRQHLYSSGLINRLFLLSGKNLGCFCLPQNRCHVDILIEEFNKRFQPIFFVIS